MPFNPIAITYQLAINYNDDACYSCVMSYRSSLQALKQSGDSPNGEYCGEALLLSLSSTATDSANSIPRIFLVYGVK